MSYFLAVAEELNFNRAAARLNMAQPPLTRQIKAIEEKIGTLLFVRKSTGVALTDAGRVLLAEIPTILDLGRRAQERARMAGKGLAGLLDIGVFGSPVLDLVPRLLMHMQRELPEVKFKLHAYGKPDQLQALREHRIAVGFTRIAADGPFVKAETVCREKLFVAMHETNALSKRRSLTLRDLEDEPLILYPNIPMPNMAQEVMNAFRTEKVRLNVSQMVEDMVTSVALVACGFGSCIVAESAKTLQLPGVAYRPLKSPTLRDIELACVYRRDDTSPVLAAFLEIVRSFRWERS